MGLLKLLPQGLKLKLLLSLLNQAADTLEAQHVGQQLNTLMDTKLGTDVANPAQVRLAQWLQQVAKELVS